MADPTEPTHLSTTSKIGNLSFGDHPFIQPEKAEQNPTSTSSSQAPLPESQPTISQTQPTQPTQPAQAPILSPEQTSTTNLTPKIHLRCPRKYQTSTKKPEAEEWQAPPLEWLVGTWAVTHSTLPMWRKAKNVRITYNSIPSSGSNPTLLDDTVTSIPTSKTWMPQPSSIHGIDTPDGHGAWAWRGKGLLKIASSKWEVLGWGETGEGEKWVVTWFAASLFTPMGVDFYSSMREGMSGRLFGELSAATEKLESKECVELVKADMREVKIEY